MGLQQGFDLLSPEGIAGVGLVQVGLPVGRVFLPSNSKLELPG
jgi:hypothetical protein